MRTIHQSRVVLLAAALFALPLGAAAADLVPPTPDLVRALVTALDDGEWVGELMREGSARGVPAALAAAGHLDSARAQRSEKLYELIAVTARSRQMPAEVLRLYDPAAHRLFYDDEGRRQQAAVAAGLEWKTWPYYLPEAVVRAAPESAIAWLERQAMANKPDTDHITRLLGEWSRWMHERHERQYIGGLDRPLAALVASKPVMADDVAAAAVLRAIGASAAKSLLGFAADALASDRPRVRAAACQALGELGGPEALAALVRHAAAESDPKALASLGIALHSFPDAADAGAAALDVFRRTTSIEARRDLLYGLADTSWPQREALILAAFEVPHEGVLGTALNAVTADASPQLVERVLSRLRAHNEALAPLIDAAGRLGRADAMPLLLAWLADEDNVAVRTKIVLALERIGGPDVERTMARLLETEAHAESMQHIIRIVGRFRIQAGLPGLIEMANDATAPGRLRAEAVWALGHLGGAEARACLQRFADDPSQIFAGADEAVSRDELEQARLFVELARLKLGEPGADEAVAELYARGTATTRLTTLVVMGELRLEHPLLKQQLRAPDFPVVLGAVRAMIDIDPKRHRADLVSFRDEPFVAQLLETGLQDVSTLRYYVERGIAGKGGV